MKLDGGIIFMNTISYRLISKTYDVLDYTYFKKEGNSPRRAVLDFIPEGKIKILDICAGTATNSIIIAKERMDSEVIGIDRSNEMLSLAKKKISEEQCKNIQVRFEDALSMSFPDEMFDFALISLVLHESSEDFNKKLFAEAARVLKKEGKLMIVEWEEPKTFLKKIFFLPIKLMEPKGFRSFLKMDMNMFFSDHGFHIKETKHCDYSKIYLLEKC